MVHFNVYLFIHSFIYFMFLNSGYSLRSLVVLQLCGLIYTASARWQASIKARSQIRHELKLKLAPARFTAENTARAKIRQKN